MGIGKNTVLDRVIVDKNARIGDEVKLANERNVKHSDGDMKRAPFAFHNESPSHPPTKKTLTSVRDAPPHSDF